MACDAAFIGRMSCRGDTIFVTLLYVAAPRQRADYKPRIVTALGQIDRRDLAWCVIIEWPVEFFPRSSIQPCPWDGEHWATIGKQDYFSKVMLGIVAARRTRHLARCPVLPVMCCIVGLCVPESHDYSSTVRQYPAPARSSRHRAVF